MKKLFISLATVSAVILSSCCGNKEKEETPKTEMQQLVESYAPVKLSIRQAAASRQPVEDDLNSELRIKNAEFS